MWQVGLGSFHPKTENRTEPNRTEVSVWSVFGFGFGFQFYEPKFIGSASVFVPGAPIPRTNRTWCLRCSPTTLSNTAHLASFGPINAAYLPIQARPRQMQPEHSQVDLIPSTLLFWIPHRVVTTAAAAASERRRRARWGCLVVSSAVAGGRDAQGRKLHDGASQARRTCCATADGAVCELRAYDGDVHVCLLASCLLCLAVS